jgi:hypothetical protein
MKKPAPIQITIPEPCTQDWNEMQPAPGGRHCAHCQKAVVDFSRMTDAQLLAYFQKPAGGAACGRFTTEQLERVIKAIEVPRSTWWARVAAGLLLALGLSKNADGQVRKHASTTKEHQQSSDHITASTSENNLLNITKDTVLVDVPPPKSWKDITTISGAYCFNCSSNSLIIGGGRTKLIKMVAINPDAGRFTDPKPNNFWQRLKWSVRRIFI